jgi:hypothetical protein
MTEPLTEAFVRSWSRSLDLTNYPNMSALTSDDIYDRGQWMAPGGLVLADMVAEALDLQPGQRVPDAVVGEANLLTCSRNATASRSYRSICGLLRTKGSNGRPRPAFTSRSRHYKGHADQGEQP